MAEQAKQHLVRSACILGMQLEAGTLEILDRVGLAVGGAHLLVLLRQRVAEQPEAPVALPVLIERTLQSVSGGVEVNASGGIGAGRGDSIESRVVDARLARLRSLCINRGCRWSGR